MNYKLTKEANDKNEKYLTRLWRSIAEISSYLDKKVFLWAVVLAVISSLTNIITPFFIGDAVDRYVATHDAAGLARTIFILIGIYVFGSVVMYFQQNIMGRVSQKALYKLRGDIFSKIQSLPIAFFNQNKTGDLMSRINNDTDKLSQFLSESILRFVGSAFTLVGIGAFVIYLNWKLGLVLLSSTLLLLIITRILSPMLEKSNKRSSASLGEFTAGVSEQLTNFKAIIAFDRRNFFETFLSGLNRITYQKSLMAGFLNKLFEPIYDAAGYIAQAFVLIYGIVLISQGEITIGLLIAFLTYALRFYDPLRWIANIFGSIQISLASWSRVKDIFSLSSNLPKLAEGNKLEKADYDGIVMLFDNVGFSYEEGSHVISHVSFALQKGKTYALVGPTGGGKTTIASLMARLYDPTEGTIFWKGKDIRTYDKEILSQSISVILQEPFMFTGSVADNIRYGNDTIEKMNDAELADLLEKKNMTELLKRFPEGLQTPVQSGGENISIGQKQLISFVRTVLREPEFLILDEATANIDTVTESTLVSLIDSLPQNTTKVVIAHRLNTIKNADEILFVGGGEVKRVGDEHQVLELLKSASRK